MILWGENNLWCPEVKARSQQKLSPLMNLSMKKDELPLAYEA